MVNKTMLAIGGIIAIIIVLAFNFGAVPLQVFQGESVVLDCSSEEECRQQLIDDGASQEEAEDIDFNCNSEGVCRTRQVSGDV